MLKLVPLLATVPSYFTPLTLSVMASPALASPVTVPVTATVPPASAALMMLSAVMASTLIVAAAARSTE